jgi:hypothetical protein
VRPTTLPKIKYFYPYQKLTYQSYQSKEVKGRQHFVVLKSVGFCEMKYIENAATCQEYVKEVK